MRALLLLAMLAPVAARAADWSPDACGDRPRPPHYSLATRADYNDAVKAVNAWQAQARVYSACVLKAAHAEQTRISRQAQDRIADIQATAVSVQQDVYGRMQSQSADFKRAAAKLGK